MWNNTNPLDPQDTTTSSRSLSSIIHLAASCGATARWRDEWRRVRSWDVTLKRWSPQDLSWLFICFVSIATRKSCESRFQSWGTVCVRPARPARGRGRAAAAAVVAVAAAVAAAVAGSRWRTRRSIRLDRCFTRTASSYAKSTPTRTAREVRRLKNRK